MLDDGRYDAFIVWADARDTANDDANDTANALARTPQVEFQLTITSGAHKGEVVELLASNFAARDPIDLIGLPCTLVVERGAPRIEA